MEGIYHSQSYNYNYPPIAFIPLQQQLREKIEKQQNVSAMAAVEPLHNNEDQLVYDQHWRDHLPNTNQNERIILMRKRRQLMEQSIMEHLGRNFDRYL